MNHMTISRFARLVLAGSAMFGAATAQAVSIIWHDRPIAETLAEAAVSKRPILLYFWMDGSDHCADLWNQTLAMPDAAKDLLPFVCHSAKATTKVGRESGPKSPKGGEATDEEFEASIMATTARSAGDSS